MQIRDLVGGQWLVFVWKDKGSFNLHLFIAVCFSLLDLCVIDSSSSNAPLVENPPAQNPFLQLDEFAQQLRRSGTPLERGVQAEYTNMATTLSCMESGRVWSPGKFNFGVVTWGGGQRDGGPDFTSIQRSLGIL